MEKEKREAKRALALEHGLESCAKLQQPKSNHAYNTNLIQGAHFGAKPDRLF